MKRSFLLMMLVLTGTIAFAQNKPADTLTVLIKKYNITEQTLPLIGKQRTIQGTMVVKRGKKKIATHDFIIPLLQEPLSHIAVLDAKGQKIDPRIHYNKDETSFTYYEGTPKEGKVKVNGKAEQKELVMAGLLIWAKLIYK